MADSSGKSPACSWTRQRISTASWQLALRKSRLPCHNSSGNHSAGIARMTTSKKGQGKGRQKAAGKKAKVRGGRAGRGRRGRDRGRNAGPRPPAVGPACRHRGVDFRPAVVGRPHSCLGHDRRIGQGADVPLRRRPAHAPQPPVGHPPSAGVFRRGPHPFAVGRSARPGDFAAEYRARQGPGAQRPQRTPCGCRSGSSPEPRSKRSCRRSRGSANRVSPSRSTCWARRPPASATPTPISRPIST